MKTNSRGVAITRPDQILILMRGIPGSGKSTKAKELVGSGAIHSTDDVIEAMGDYTAIFENMKATNDFGKLFGAHMTNVRNARKSMEAGLSPVIIDNTNIKKADMKPYIKDALILGFDDANIQFVDVGTGGLTAEALAARNTHGVPLASIEKMIASHKGKSPINIKTVMEAKDKTEESNVLYTGVFLEKASQNVLFHNLEHMIPEGWKRFGHHMTICLGPMKDKSLLDTEALLRVTHVGLSDMAMAVKVESDIKTKNPIPHVTVAINPEGGMPSMSNDITKWQDVRLFLLLGKVEEFKKR